jgi:hypothetical protein
MKTPQTFQGQIQKHVRDITYNKDKLNYTINVLLTRAVYGPTEEITEPEETLGTRPLLAMMLHTGTKKNKMYRKSKIFYRPMSCYNLSQENDMNEGKCVIKALLRRQTAKHHYPPDPSTYTPLQKTHNRIHRTRKVRCTNRRCTST